MKKEELERLEAKFLAGETSLSEERLLRKNKEDHFLKTVDPEASGQMPYAFEDFMEHVTVAEMPVKICSKINWWKPFISVAAAMLLIAVGLVYFSDNQEIKLVESNHSQVKELKIANEANRELISKPALQKNHSQVRSNVKLAMKAPRRVVKPIVIQDSVTLAAMEEFFVEVNGVKITNEAEALKITETALIMASSNLTKSVQQVENLEYLLITL